jgi:glycosyltransferase involved in cell wall biosynthesis
MNNSPLISIIIPTYNGEKYIDEALLSVFTQTYKNYEVIVVDDGSVTDSVARICDKYKGGIKYIRQQNKGLAAARNTGIRNSKGDYLAFLDDDDLWLPEKLEKQVRLYKDLESKGITAGIVYTGIEDINETGKPLYKTLYRSSGYCYDILLFIDFIGYGGSSAMVPSSILIDVGYFDETMRRVEDYDLWIRIAKRYPIYSVNDYLVKYRNRDGSLHKEPLEMIKGEMYILNKVLNDRDNSDWSARKTKRLSQWYRKKAAMRFKDSAYEALFEKADPRSFRNYIRGGLSWGIKPFGLKVWAYYLLSLISPRACNIIKKFGVKMLDINIDVKDLRLN